MKLSVVLTMLVLASASLEEHNASLDGWQHGGMCQDNATDHALVYQPFDGTSIAEMQTLCEEFCNGVQGPYNRWPCCQIHVGSGRYTCSGSRVRALAFGPSPTDPMHNATHYYSKLMGPEESRGALNLRSVPEPEAQNFLAPGMFRFLAGASVLAFVVAISFMFYCSCLRRRGSS
jgi:hypothetical protein